MTSDTDRSENSLIDTAPPVRKRLIGSQRNPDAYRSKPDIPVVDAEHSQSKTETVNNSTLSSASSAEKIDGQPDRLTEGGNKPLQDVSAAALKRVPIPKIRAGKMSDDL
ncbi:MAG: hypothetical protein LBF88_07330, partial [Planctomycetaceae bacterium]|nr:hypothetical protein [Planctomycetaceae bacterium]